MRVACPSYEQEAEWLRQAGAHREAVRGQNWPHAHYVRWRMPDGMVMSDDEAHRFANGMLREGVEAASAWVEFENRWVSARATAFVRKGFVESGFFDDESEGCCDE